MKFSQFFKKVFGNENSENKIDVNQPAPDFSLPDEHGNAIKLSEFKGKRDVILFFIRGDFCPYCQMMLRTYQKEQDKFREKNIMLMSIGPGPTDKNYEIVKKFGLEYKVLCDNGQKIIRQYGALDEADKRAYPEGMPVPATILVDRKGIIRYCSRADKTEDTFNPTTIYNALKSLN